MIHGRRTTRLLVPILLALVAGLVVLRGPAGPPAEGALPDIALQPIATGLDNPTAIARADDGSGRLFIALQAGRIVIYDGTQILPAPFLDIGSLVSCCGEQGLLGIAFHPDYETNGYFYVDYTDLAGDTVVARYQVSADPDIADDTSATTLLTIDQPFGNHNGGQLEFGPQDGYLYIAVGDGGSAGDPQNNGQDTSTLLGKILRIDVDGGPPYGIPPDNPFVGDAGALDEIWAWGLRNPWRFSFDRLTGDLFIADVGQSNWEEVNFQPAASSGGENYGWRRMEGTHCFNPPAGCDNGTLTLPILEYSHGGGNCSVTGGYRYRGTDISGLAGAYVYGDFCSGRIWGATESGGIWTASELLDTQHNISTFGEDEAGELYLAHRSSSGTIFRIVPAGDTDGDGVENGPDNCLSIPNPGQENADAAIGNGAGIAGDDTTVANGDPTDTQGDACETDGDADNDGILDGSDPDPGGDITYDDNGNGDPCPPLGSDGADDGPSWDADCNGVLDGFEATCPLVANPSGDDDGDGLRNSWEVCKWGTNPTVVDSDGDGLGDCQETADVDGSGAVDFVGDVIDYAKAALLPRALFGQDGDFDVTGDATIDFVGDVIQEAKFGLVAGLCQ